jgi:flagellar biogenesis protein FliO
MKVLEIASVGPGSTIQLVKVSEEYFLVGVSRTQITFMTKLDTASMAALYPEYETETPQKPKFLEFLSNRSQKSKDEP